MDRGVFVAIDGPDGVGKSRIVSELNSVLKDTGYDVLITKEVTTGPIGALIRDQEFSGLILAHLVAADRLYHIDHIIIPALREGKIVISDRYVASSYVCQQLDGVPLDYIQYINSSIIAPDVSVFVSAEISTILKRLSQRPKLFRMEKMSTKKTVDLYNEAIKLFQKNNYGCILKLNNNDEKDLINNIDIIKNAIITCLGDKL